MKKAEKNKRWRSYNRFREAQEAIWIPRVLFALKQQLRGFTDFAKDQGLMMAVPQIDVLVKPDPIRRVITNLFRSVFPRYANISAKQIIDDYGAEMAQQKAFGTPNAYWLQLVREYMLTDGATQVTEVTDTTKEYIRRMVIKGLENGDSIDEILQTILQNDINSSRARLIARTETAGAMNYAAQGAAKRSGLAMTHEWLTARDNRVRHLPQSKFDHRAMEGVKLPLSEPFNVNGELLKRPADPAGSPGNICNCRCCEVHEAIRDENGRLITAPVSRIYVERPAPSNITQIITI